MPRAAQSAPRRHKLNTSHPTPVGSFHAQQLRARRLLRQLFSLRVTRIAIIFVIFLILAPLILFFIIRPKPASDIAYGVTFSKKYAEDIGLDWKDAYIKILDDLGAKHIRIVAYWDESEPTNDEYRFDDVKWQIEEAQKRDAKIIMTIGHKVTRWPECFQPAWWEQEKNEFVQRIELDEYIEQATVQLKDYDGIVMWQVENEPFFPFGTCPVFRSEDIEREIAIVRKADDRKRPILVQDSGEGGFWKPTYRMGDYLGISMYRKIWFDFWGVVFGKSVYFQYPLAHWTYQIKAKLLGVPVDKIIVTELQAEPWGPGINSSLTQEQKNKTMSRADFLAAISYAQKTGFQKFYLWGVEWWLWEKEKNNNSYYWDTARALFSEHPK